MMHSLRKGIAVAGDLRYHCTRMDCAKIWTVCSQGPGRSHVWKKTRMTLSQIDPFQEQGIIFRERLMTWIASTETLALWLCPAWFEL
jgi:hypothetical protein